MKSGSLILFLIILLTSCSSFPFSGPKKNKNPLFDTIPVNFTDLNSVYDDYNSAYPPGLWGFEKEIAFSTNRNSGGPEVVTGLKGFDPINTGFNESYPTIRDKRLYFNSNRAGYYNIYSCEIVNDRVFENYEIELSPDVIFENKLSGLFDDKCPFILDNVMVFTSNRDSGFGGFDLYYSVFDKGQWSDPVNLGSNINTEYDEYRPIIIPAGDNSGNDLMIFSSNRPGGSGGFDLYYVGVPKEFE